LETPVQRARWWTGAIGQTLLWTLLGFVALQLWRPCFFLTDDNLDGAWPVMVAAMRRVWHGQSAFFEPNLFGGYNLLRDPSALGLWNPLNLLLSPLALTRWNVIIVDILCGFHLALAAVGMVRLGLFFRQRDDLAISDRRLAFFGFSYAFSIYALSVGASWCFFLTNIAVLPWIVLGLWHPRRRTGLVLVAGVMLYSLLAGHTHPWLWTVLFCSLMAIGASWERRSSWPLLCWCGALALALVLALPFLIPALSGFGGSTRSGAQGAQAALFRLPWLVALLSWPLGSLSALSGQPYNALTLATGHGYALACCAAGGCLWHGVGRGRLRRLEALALTGAAVALLMILRPDPVVALFSHLPLLRSLRWPFREVLFLIFFLHWFMMLRPVTWPRPLALTTAGIGVFIWAASLLAPGPPSFAPMPVDRALVLSGAPISYWTQVKAMTGPGTRFAVTVPKGMPQHRLNEIPWSLLGAFNYPALYEVPSMSGYTIRGFHQDRFGDPARHHSGAFTLEEGRQLAREPGVSVVALDSLEPLKISLHQVNFSEARPLPVPGQGSNQ
jgi:hypothetical protein